MLLLAIAALSRIRFPERKKGQPGYKTDRQAFVEYLKSGKKHHLNGFPPDQPFDGETLQIEEFLYKCLRCPLVHNGGLPEGMQPIHPNHLFSIPAHDNETQVDSRYPGIARRQMPVGYGFRLLDRLTTIVENGCRVVEDNKSTED